MKLIKYLIMALAGFALGIGATQLVGTLQAHNEPQDIFENDLYYGCHGGVGSIEDLFARFSEDDQVLLQAHLDAWLIEHDVTYEALEEDWSLHREYMIDLMTYLEDQDIEPESSTPFRHGGHMGW
jgi:hypothetical protein